MFSRPKVKTMSYIGGYFDGAIHRFDMPIGRNEFLGHYKTENLTPTRVEYLYVFDRFVGDRAIMVCRGQRIKVR